ncbi:MAG: Co2+/Mg2+ efflux protein ApaG [Candidatus Binatia bacterium]
MPSAVTEGIRVTVESTYLTDRSQPEQNSYAFAYMVTIANEGHERVQLMRRHWRITDGNGEVREVEGPGVVGEQPVLAKGDVHEYTSGAVLTTPVGTMEGTYEMHAPDGHVFRAAIPRFALQKPGVLQ